MDELHIGDLEVLEESDEVPSWMQGLPASDRLAAKFEAEAVSRGTSWCSTFDAVSLAIIIYSLHTRTCTL